MCERCNLRTTCNNTCTSQHDLGTGARAGRMLMPGPWPACLLLVQAPCRAGSVTCSRGSWRRPCSKPACHTESWLGTASSCSIASRYDGRACCCWRPVCTWCRHQELSGAVRAACFGWPACTRLWLHGAGCITVRLRQGTHALPLLLLHLLLLLAGDGRQRRRPRLHCTAERVHCVGPAGPGQLITWLLVSLCGCCCCCCAAQHPVV